MDVVREARFSAAYTFQYSKRPGTPAAEMQNQVAHETVQERYERLVELVGRIAWEENRRFEGQEIEVMFALGEGRKDSETNRMSGRARDNRLVHVAVGEEPSDRPRPRDIAYATITHAAPHHLNSDAPPQGTAADQGRRCVGSGQHGRNRAQRGSPGHAEPAAPLKRKQPPARDRRLPR